MESVNKTVDIGHLKEKVEAGCDFVTTQMFFDKISFIITCTVSEKKESRFRLLRHHAGDKHKSD